MELASGSSEFSDCELEVGSMSLPVELGGPKIMLRNVDARSAPHTLVQTCVEQDRPRTATEFDNIIEFCKHLQGSENRAVEIFGVSMAPCQECGCVVRV